MKQFFSTKRCIELNSNQVSTLEPENSVISNVNFLVDMSGTFASILLSRSFNDKNCNSGALRPTKLLYFLLVNVKKPTLVLSIAVSLCSAAESDGKVHLSRYQNRI